MFSLLTNNSTTCYAKLLSSKVENELSVDCCRINKQLIFNLNTLTLSKHLI
jgi:hypothetical protein